MRNYSNSSLLGTIVKGVLLLIAVIIVVSIFQKLLSVVATLLFFAVLIIGVLALFRYFTRRRR